MYCFLEPHYISLNLIKLSFNESVSLVDDGVCCFVHVGSWDQKETRMTGTLVGRINVENILSIRIMRDEFSQKTNNNQWPQYLESSKQIFKNIPVNQNHPKMITLMWLTN